MNKHFRNFNKNGIQKFNKQCKNKKNHLKNIWKSGNAFASSYMCAKIYYK